MEAGLATYAANPNVGQYKGATMMMSAPGPKMMKPKKKESEMGCKSPKKK